MPKVDMSTLHLPIAPPLDPAWLAYEARHGFNDPKPPISVLDRQPQYAEEERAKTRRMIARGARDHHLGKGIKTSTFTVPSSIDAFPVPILLFAPEDAGTDLEDVGQRTTIIYIHGGGLKVGEADSEELSCRRVIKESGLPGMVLYSIGYRLMPTYPASTCVQDCHDATRHILSLPSVTGGKVVLIGSSSGGELAPLLAPSFHPHITGMILRCPVTSDAYTSYPKYIPERFRAYHTSSAHPSFQNCLLRTLTREEPRDGLLKMPLEMSKEEMEKMPERVWVQVCTNDGLYSDGVCIAKALEEDGGKEVRVDVEWGWPHTFWLKAWELDKALECERKMVKAIRWAAGEEEEEV